MEPELKNSTAALKEIGLGLTNAGFENDEGRPDNDSPVSLENVKRNIAITLPNNENLRCGNASTINEKEQERWGCRHTLAAMSFLGLLVSYIMRVNFSIAIVAMVGTRAKNVTSFVHHNHSEGFPDPQNQELKDNQQTLASMEFNWDEKMQGILLGAFYWGYTATLLIAGRTAERYGGRLIFGWSLVICSVINILTPFCARTSTVLLVVVRLLSGAAQVRSIPWKDIAKSLPFWSIVAASFGYSFGFYTLLSGLPLYFSNILLFDLKENGLLSALPYASMTIMIFLWGILMDLCTQRSIISIKATRKLSTGVGGYGPMIGLVTMYFVGQDTLSALGILCMAVILSGTSFCGYPVSNQDIAPNLSGTLVGLTNTVGASTGFLAPGIMGLITQGNQNLDAWRLVFLISSAVLFVSTTFYVVFATNQIQPWNAVDYNSTRKKQDSEAPGGKADTVLQKY
ncbi:sialin-like isoform X1 [Macrobrachium nipponense]|uniref:sialin-like isoform X1 n=1 Tax=Macrobrachium nipponense TaxID=159736 RepID=UPI0030C815BB